eukprot:2498624-Pleurochrysis_carterae.AAC.2
MSHHNLSRYHVQSMRALDPFVNLVVLESHCVIELRSLVIRWSDHYGTESCHPLRRSLSTAWTSSRICRTIQT